MYHAASVVPPFQGYVDLDRPIPGAALRFAPGCHVVPLRGMGLDPFGQEVGAWASVPWRHHTSPNGAKHESPGHRPGWSRGTDVPRATTGRRHASAGHRPGNWSAIRYPSPERATHESRTHRVWLWFVAGLDTIGYETDRHREAGHSSLHRC